MGNFCVSKDNQHSNNMEGVPMKGKIKSTAGPQCTDTKHFGTQGICGSGDCKTSICSYC
jgi:hypothetical protein